MSFLGGKMLSRIAACALSLALAGCAAIRLNHVDLPNGFIAIPDKTTHDRVGGLTGQTTTTDVKLSFTVPRGIRFKQLSAVFTCRKNGREQVVPLAVREGLELEETVKLILTQEPFESNTDEMFGVKLVWTAGGRPSESNVLTVPARRLICNVDFDPPAYRLDEPVCPYTSVHAAMDGSKNPEFEWLGLLTTYSLSADLTSLTAVISGGKAGSIALSSMAGAKKLAGTPHALKWECYDSTIKESPDVPYAVIANMRNVGSGVPQNVVKEGDYEYAIHAVASDAGLCQSHSITGIRIHVRCKAPGR